MLELLVPAIAPTLFILLYIYREDRYEPEPSRSLPGFSWRPHGLRSDGEKTRRDRTVFGKEKDPGIIRKRRDRSRNLPPAMVCTTGLYKGIVGCHCCIRAGQPEQKPEDPTGSGR
jgi:hypothetical protein